MKQEDARMTFIDFSRKVVEMTDIVKTFGKVVANDQINLTVHKGEVHALLGENGAGKTTLMNVLYGLYQPTAGSIRINGSPLKISSPHEAIRNGIGMVHQHFMLVDPFTVTENIILGHEPTRFMALPDLKTARKKVLGLSEKYGLAIDPDARIQDISVGGQQRVEILKALYRGAQILILDEPTAVLTPSEIRELALIVRNLTREGKSVIIITHKLKEIKQMADFCTIIRQGRPMGTVDVRRVSEQELASMMVGHDVCFTVEKQTASPGQTVLVINDLVVENSRKVTAIKGLSLELRQGEILGIAGVDGNGQTELVETLTGLRKAKSGRIRIKGQDVFNRLPGEMIHAHNIGHIPENRQKRGLIAEFDIAENLILKNYSTPLCSKGFFLIHKQIYAHALRLIRQFDIRPQDPRVPAGALSGGNQQKMIIAREMSGHPEILIAAQPTRGLDVGAVEYVHNALVARRNQGTAILLVSFDLDEILRLSDRIAVIYEGAVAGIVAGAAADEKQIGWMMAGGTA